jgi:hypothetical protein
MKPVAQSLMQRRCDALVDHHGAWATHGLCFLTLHAESFIFQNIVVAKKKILTPFEVRKNLERQKYTQQGSYSLELKPK